MHRVLGLIFLTFFFGATTRAAKMPLLTDQTVTTTSEILNRIQMDSMALIREKYEDLEKNYTPHYLTTGLDMDCRTGSYAVTATSQYSGFRISTESRTLKPGQILTNINVSHTDCGGRLIFNEKIVVIGAAPVKMTVVEAAKFQRSFEVLSGETYRQYQLENSMAKSVLTVTSQRLSTTPGERIYSSVEIVGVKFLDFDQLDPSVNERKIFIQAHAGTFQFNDFKSRYSFNSTLKTFWTEKKIEQGVENSAISQVDFDTMLASLVVGNATSMIKTLFGQFILKFPQTKKVEVGVSDSPFLRELQLNYNRMVTSTELDQVKLFLQKSIAEIKAGRLKVE